MRLGPDVPNLEESNDQFAGMRPCDWIEANWRRYLYSPSGLSNWLEDGGDLPDIGGVYFLWRGPSLLYVGIANAIYRRIDSHTTARRIPFDDVSGFEVAGRFRRDLYLKAIECAYIRALSPPYNAHDGYPRGEFVPRMSRAIRLLWRQSLAPGFGQREQRPFASH